MRVKLVPRLLLGEHGEKRHNGAATRRPEVVPASSRGTCPYKPPVGGDGGGAGGRGRTWW